MLSKEIIIIGGGYSINQGIKLGLKNHIQDKFVIGCNYSFLHFPLTLLTFLDKNFYVPNYAKEKPIKHPDIYNKLKELPLIVGLNRNTGLSDSEFLLPNTVLLKPSDIYNNDPLKKGFYHRKFTGIFSLTLASFLLDFEGTIFLLGFDEPKILPLNAVTRTKPHTHYYQHELKHYGVGKISIFHKSNDRFLPFTKEKGLHIYNVSPGSTIECFEKINYYKMFNLLSKEIYNQTNLRKEIKNKLI